VTPNQFLVNFKTHPILLRQGTSNFGIDSAWPVRVGILSTKIKYYVKGDMVRDLGWRNPFDEL